MKTRLIPRRLVTGHDFSRANRAYGIKSGFSPCALLLLAVCLIPTALRAATPGKTLVCFGDSITAGYGLDASQSYPSDLESLLAKRGYAYHVVNQGVSGNTTKDAVARVHSIVSQHPDAVVVEFGGNDGLRGLPLDTTRKNLDDVLSTLQAAKIPILLVGITLPPNYGAEYIKSFNSIYREAAAKHHLALMPMIYDGIYTVPGTIQQDGIHPTAKGSQMIADHMLPLLLPLLHK
jgi:acyl-CoA thioesterase-1